MNNLNRLSSGIVLFLFALLTLFCVSGCTDHQQAIDNAFKNVFPVPSIDFKPKSYICSYSMNPIKIDGIISDLEWGNAEWTDSFVDIEGSSEPKPYYQTNVKMLWDSTYFYVAAKLEEPHVWANLTNRDAVIFYDNDFEVFIDPDGDTHEYYEYEMNALNTVWDLLLVKPYRDGGTAVDAWDISGLKSAVHIQGTLNNPAEADEFWSLEIAFPWKILEECAHKETPPKPGDYWRVNFSRVEWDTEIVQGKYVKKTDENGKNLPEHNWVWSPQGIINMHYPEMWGFVQFVESVDSKTNFVIPELELAKWELRKVYYFQRNLFENTGSYAKDKSFLHSLGLSGNSIDNISYESNSIQWFASMKLPMANQTIRIFDNGKTEVIFNGNEK